jgi:transposase
MAQATANFEFSVAMTIDYEAELLKRDQQIAELLQRNQEMAEEIKRLKELLTAKGKAKSAQKPRFKLNYSLAGRQRRSKRGKQATGRYPKAKKSAQLNVSTAIYPSGVAPQTCEVSRHQFVWRIIEGKAQYVDYTIYAEPGNPVVPKVSGVRNRRSEYGVEIILMVAFLHYWIGISLDHVCEVLQFFTGLKLSKSQANALLNQLRSDWSAQYETIAELLAVQMVIYIDETGWKVGAQSCYTWAFSSLRYVLFRCGVGRGKAEAQAILGERFKGIGVSDDYAAYKSLFEQHQLCWAHLLRKAIKLRLEHPDEAEYGVFLEQLCDLYQQAVRWQKDGRLSVGRPQKVAQLQADILALCPRAGESIDSESMPTHAATFVRLQNELVNGLEALFVFVAHPDVEPTNNRSERNVRREAEVRKGGRTSKTKAGAERRSIVMSVLATLNTRFEKFTLTHLTDEVHRWIEQGYSIFQLELAAITQANPPPLTT